MATDGVYRLRCSLHGHTSDVRCLAVVKDAVLSGSRDKTSQLWMENESGEFHVQQTFKGHENFVSSVCYAEPTEVFPDGLVYTGSNDKTILAFTLSSAEPVQILKGHSGTVCALASCKPGVLASGSWDKTAKLWLNGECITTLEGHTEAIWAIAYIPECDLLLTGSADKTICSWRDGALQKLITGHTDCVRDLSVISSSEFLSSSNDTMIRWWNVDGKCLRILNGHTNFVYSISVLSRSLFASTSEDRTVRIWSNGELKQTLFMPCQTIWCVRALNNGDIVVGSSDGVIRIFSADPERQASPLELAAFEKEVAECKVAAQLEMGGIKINELPGPEILLQPGKKDGQTKLIREGASKIICYSWSQANGEWTKVGDVLGANEATTGSEGKKMFEGKEYDYVFDVELQEGSPPLKLPFNVTDDPWFAAQAFIHKHELSQLFLDQIANFIISNTKGMTLGTSANDRVFEDPFTGGSRYIPGSDPVSNCISAQSQMTNSGPPATDRIGHESSGVGLSNGVSSDHRSPGNYFPHLTMLKFDQASNIEKIMTKLNEINISKGDSALSSEIFAELSKLASGQNGNAANLLAFDVMLKKWSRDEIFPILDLIRILLCHKEPSQALCQGARGLWLLDSLLVHIASKHQANSMLALRCLCNVFVHEHGVKLVMENRDHIIKIVLPAFENANKNVQVAGATLMINASISCTQGSDYAKNIDVRSQTLLAVVTAVPKLTDPEAVFRALVALGNLIYGNVESVQLCKSLNLKPTLENIKAVNDTPKVIGCIDQITSEL